MLSVPRWFISKFCGYLRDVDGVSYGIIKVCTVDANRQADLYGIEAIQTPAVNKM